MLHAAASTWPLPPSAGTTITTFSVLTTLVVGGAYVALGHVTEPVVRTAAAAAGTAIVARRRSGSARSDGATASSRSHLVACPTNRPSPAPPSQHLAVYAAMTVAAAVALVWANTIQARRYISDALERLSGVGDTATEGTWAALFTNTALFLGAAATSHFYGVDRFLLLVQPADYTIEQWKLSGYFNMFDAAAALGVATAVVAGHAFSRYRLF